MSTSDPGEALVFASPVNNILRSSRKVKNVTKLTVIILVGRRVVVRILDIRSGCVVGVVVSGSIGGSLVVLVTGDIVEDTVASVRVGCCLKERHIGAKAVTGFKSALYQCASDCPAIDMIGAEFCPSRRGTEPKQALEIHGSRRWY